MMKHNNDKGRGRNARPALLSPDRHATQHLLAHVLTYANTGQRPDKPTWRYIQTQGFKAHRRPADTQQQA
jgi:hypothetical protein